MDKNDSAECIGQAYKSSFWRCMSPNICNKIQFSIAHRTEETEPHWALSICPAFTALVFILFSSMLPQCWPCHVHPYVQMKRVTMVLLPLPFTTLFSSSSFSSASASMHFVAVFFFLSFFQCSRLKWILWVFSPFFVWVHRNQ